MSEQKVCHWVISWHKKKLKHSYDLRFLHNGDLFRFVPQSIVIHTGSYKQRNECTNKKVQVGKDQEKAQSERDSHSKNRGGKNQTNNQALIP